MAVPTSTVIETYNQAGRDVVTLAIRDLVQLMRGSTDTVADLQRYLPQIATAYGQVAADLAAEFYTEARSTAGVTTRFTPVTTPWQVSGDRIESLIRWGTRPSTTSSPESLIAGGLQRIVMGAFRDTVGANVAADTRAYGYARRPAPGACAFCAMLSTNVYQSKGSAAGVTGVRQRRRIVADGLRRRVSTPELTGRTRGPRGLGERYHDHCNCRVVPVFRMGDHVNPMEDIVAITPAAQRYHDIYTAVARPGMTTSEILTAMRKEGDFTR